MTTPNQPRYSRRRFLVGAAATVATSSAFRRFGGTLDLMTRPGFRLPPPQRSGVEHIVVLMMENRSFDHLLGWVPGADGKQAGLAYIDRDGRPRATYPLAPDFQGCGHHDPDHSHADGLAQYNNGKCDGFLRNTTDPYPIGYYRRRDLPFLGRAATDWTTCDRYFSPLMGETFGNRTYVHAAAAVSFSDPHRHLTIATIWDRLLARRLPARAYHAGGEPFLKNWGSKYDSVIAPYGRFVEDCRRGRLPNVAYVDPPRAGSETGRSRDDHPFGDVRAGEAFMNGVYSAVTRSPNWRSTVLVITFDEWGGFFDHVAPSEAPDAYPDFRLRGFRVPCLVISPFARRRFVSHTVFDHTSVLRMIEWRWSLRPLSVRDRTANNLAVVLDFSRRRLGAPRYRVPDVVSKRC